MKNTAVSIEDRRHFQNRDRNANLLYVRYVRDGRGAICTADSRGTKMTDEQIAELILHRLYHGAFEMGVEYAPNLHEFAKEIGVENNRIWEAYYRLNDQYLVEAFAIGGSVNITSSGIHYCETNGIAEDDLAAHQQQTRTRLLDAAMRLREKHGHNALIDWTHLCSEADVEEQDFHNNYHFLVDFGMLESTTLRSFQITPAGMKAVEDYRQRVATPQSVRGTALAGRDDSATTRPPA